MDLVKTILAPVDFSGISDSVVDQAGVLARAIGARVIFLNILQPPVITSECFPPIENIDEVVAVAERTASNQLARIYDRLTAEGIAVETMQLTGAPVVCILQQAASLAADYLVMGSHGHTAFYDLLVGSTTHGVLLKARCPVVIVPDQSKRSAPK